MFEECWDLPPPKTLPNVVKRWNSCVQGPQRHSRKFCEKLKDVWAVARSAFLALRKKCVPESMSLHREVVSQKQSQKRVEKLPKHQTSMVLKQRICASLQHIACFFRFFWDILQWNVSQNQCHSTEKQLHKNSRKKEWKKCKKDEKLKDVRAVVRSTFLTLRKKCVPESMSLHREVVPQKQSQKRVKKLRKKTNIDGFEQANLRKFA